MLGAQALRTKQRCEEKEKERRKKQQQQKRNEEKKAAAASSPAFLKVAPEFGRNGERKKASSTVDLSKLQPTETSVSPTANQRRHSQTQVEKLKREKKPNSEPPTP